MVKCIACQDTLKSSNGFPCHLCVVAKRIPPQPYVNSGKRLVRQETREEALLREFMGLARAVAAAQAEPARREETPEEKLAALRRLEAEYEEMAGGSAGIPTGKGQDGT